MIGKPVSSDELERVLEKQAAEDKFVKQIEEELKAIKPGECLLYKSGLEVPLWASVGFALLVDRIKGLKVIKEEYGVYVYREK